MKTIINRVAASVPQWTLWPWETNGTTIMTEGTPCTVIGRAYDKRDDCGIESFAEAEANARLMAAAPELYIALLTARRIISGEIIGDNAAINRIDAALAKAMHAP